MVPAAASSPDATSGSTSATATSATARHGRATSHSKVARVDRIVSGASPDRPLELPMSVARLEPGEQRQGGVPVRVERPPSENSVEVARVHDGGADGGTITGHRAGTP